MKKESMEKEFVGRATSFPPAILLNGYLILVTSTSSTKRVLVVITKVLL